MTFFKKKVIKNLDVIEVNCIKAHVVSWNGKGTYIRDLQRKVKIFVDEAEAKHFYNVIKESYKVLCCSYELDLRIEEQ